MSGRWKETVDAHRVGIREVILHAVGEMAAGSGLGSITMSSLAERAGIGRATLYRYFPNLDAVLAGWHEAQVARHVAHLGAIADRTERPDRLRSVLEAYASLSRRQPGDMPIDELVAHLHRGDHVHRARSGVSALIAELIGEAAEDGLIRDDVAPHELALFCIHALGAAAELRSDEAARRLVALIWDGLRAE